VKRAVESTGAPKPIGPYSQAIDAGTVVFCAGQIGLDPATGALVVGGVAAEAEQAIRNVAAVLATAGLGLADVVKTTVFLLDIREGRTLNDVYARLFPPPYPARSTIAVAALPAGARVEIEAIAVRQS
jgi:2-iminobutanoate/2-iminopropanoate deaminase